MARARPIKLAFWGDVFATGNPPRLRRYVDQSLDDHWLARAEIEVRDGRAEITELRIFWSWEIETGPGSERRLQRWDRPQGGLSAAVLRAVQIRAITEFAQKSLLKEAQRVGPVPGDYLRSAPQRPGRRRDDDRLLAEIAATYVAELAGGGHGVITRTARRFSEEHRGSFSPAYVRRKVSQARDRGLLTPTERGRAGGQLTDRARELLT